MILKDLIATKTGFTVSILRVALGWILFTDGSGKLWSWFDGRGMRSALQFYDQIGVPFSPYHGYLIAGCELVAGALLLLGFMTRLAVIPALITTIGAIYMFGRMGGGIHNSHLMAFIICLVLLQLGGGPASVDGLITKSREE